MKKKTLNKLSLAKEGISVYPGGIQRTPTGQSNAFSNNPNSLTPEQLMAAGAKLGFRTDDPSHFQEDMYKYIAQNKPEVMSNMIKQYGPAKAGFTSYNGVQSFAPDGMIGARTAAMFQQIQQPITAPKKSVRFEKLNNPEYWKDSQGSTSQRSYYSPVYEGAWSERDIQGHQKTLQDQYASDGSPYLSGQAWRDYIQKKGPDSRSWMGVNDNGFKVPMQQLGKSPIVPAVPVAFPVPTDPRVTQDAQGNQFVRMGPAKKKFDIGGENPFGQPTTIDLTQQQQLFHQNMYGNPGAVTPAVPSGTPAPVNSQYFDISKTAGDIHDGIYAGMTAFDFLGKSRMRAESDAQNMFRTGTDGIYGDGMKTSRGTFAEGGSIIPEVGMPSIMHEEAITGNDPGLMPFSGPSFPISNQQQPSSPVTPMKNVNVNESAKYAFDFYRQQGLPDHVSAGIVGNLVTESGMNPTIKGDSGKATGIAQWHPDRFRNLVKWAAAKGIDPYHLDTQLMYVLEEAKQRGDLNKISKSTSAGDAAVTFGKHFERPSEKYANWGKRAGIAEKLMGSYQEGGEYEMSEDEIKQFLAEGGEVEYLD